jgi:hypothetical protein
MNISVFICEINASAGVFSVQFPELQAFMGPQFGNFARSDQLPGEPRPRFNTQRKVWTCSLRDIAAVNAFLCSLSGATFYIGSRSSCTVETQTPDSFEDDAVAIAAEAAAAREEALHRELMGPKPRLLHEQQIYKQNPQRWIAIRQARLAESARLYPPRRDQPPASKCNISARSHACRPQSQGRAPGAHRPAPGPLQRVRRRSGC